MLGGTGIQISNQNTGGGGGAVDSVFGRIGVVVAVSGDYTTNLVPEVTNLYFTEARVRAALLTGYVSGAGVISAADSVLSAIEKLNGNIAAIPAAPVDSVFGRTGAVVAVGGDYNTSQVTEVTNLYFTEARVYTSQLTAFTPGAGTVSIGDTLQTALEKLQGNIDAISITLNPALADLAYSGPTITLTAGEDLVTGDVCYLKSDGKMGKGDADAAATAGIVFIALATIANNASGSFGVPNGLYRNDTLYAFTPGQILYLSTTAGAITATPVSGTGDVSQVIGVALTADIVYFSPSLAMGVVV